MDKSKQIMGISPEKIEAAARIRPGVKTEKEMFELIEADRRIMKEAARTLAAQSEILKQQRERLHDRDELLLALEERNDILQGHNDLLRELVEKAEAENKHLKSALSILKCGTKVSQNEYLRLAQDLMDADRKKKAAFDSGSETDHLEAMLEYGLASAKMIGPLAYCIAHLQNRVRALEEDKAEMSLISRSLLLN